jgi:hypothetical protein
MKSIKNLCGKESNQEAILAYFKSDVGSTGKDGKCKQYERSLTCNWLFSIAF